MNPRSGSQLADYEVTRNPPADAQPGSAAFVSVVVATFSALALAGVLHHEMWRDELEIWLVARDSGSLTDLLSNMTTEVHPALWYVLNFALSRLTSDPLAMQLLNVSIGALTVFVVARHAPFSRLQRVLFCFGYFALFELTVISRSYGLLLLLKLVFCALYPHRQRAWLPIGLVLLLLSNTHLYGAMLTGCFGLLLGIEMATGIRRGELQLDGKMIGAGALAAVGLAVGLGHVAYQALQIGPSHTMYGPGMDLRWLLACVSTIYYGYVPLPNPTDPHFWNTNVIFMVPEPVGLWLSAALGVLLFVVSALLLARKPLALMVFALGSAALLGFTSFFWYGWVRHHGQIYLLFVACCWLFRTLPDRPPSESTTGARGPLARIQRASERVQWITSPLLTTLFALQVAAAAYACGADLLRPFSNAERVGQHLQRPEYQDTLLFGSMDYAVQSVAAFTDAPIFYPELDRFGSFVTWGDERKEVSAEVALDRAVELARSRQKDVLVILSYRIRGPEPGEVVPWRSGIQVEGIARFTDAIVQTENYYLYRFFDPSRDERRTGSP